MSEKAPERIWIARRDQPVNRYEWQVYERREHAGLLADGPPIEYVHADLLATARKEAREADWQPIETAPKDSSWILAVVRTGRQVVIRWGGGTWEDDNRLCRDPIYWMPQPISPALERAAATDREE